MNDAPEPPSEPVLKAIYRVMRHPVRRRMLRALRDSEEDMAPSDLAVRFEISLPAASYHVTRLVEAGLVEPTRTEPVRGTVKHYYKPSGNFAREIVDILALDQIAELLEGSADEIQGGVLGGIADVVASTGRPIRRNDK